MKNEMNEYYQQAADFLKKTGATITWEYDRHGKYFHGDKESRDIWKFTIKRGRKKYSAEFGQSIANAGEQPSDYTLLAGLTSYDPGDHEWFCSNYGYDVDSISGLATYKAVVKEWKGVSKLFTEEELELLQEIN